MKREGRPIRVLHVCTIALTAHTFIAPVARYLSVRGYEVALACSTADAPDGPQLVDDGALSGIPIHHIQISRSIHPIKDLLAVWKLYRLIKRLRPTIVHTQTSKAGIVGRLAARWAGTPVVIHTAHAFPFHQYLPFALRWLYVVIERWAAHLTDLLIVDTESVRADGLHFRIVSNSDKLVVVSMGLDLKKFSPAPDPSSVRQQLGFGHDNLVVGTVARLVPDKGIECFLRMAFEIRKARADVRFLIVGDGPLRLELERLADDLGLREVTVFTGHREQVPRFMESMDVFVLPTRREGFGVVFAEAMAMGVPVVGSRIGPVAEVVEEGVTGYLSSPDRPDEFAEHVLALLNDESKRRAFGKAGRRRVEKYFDEAKMCERIEQLYCRLLEEKMVTV